MVVDVGSLGDADLATVDILARLQLCCRRLGYEIRLDHASVGLRELLGFAGLREVLPCSAPSALEARREAEQGEEPGRVEEEGDAADPTVRDLEHLE